MYNICFCTWHILHNQSVLLSIQLLWHSYRVHLDFRSERRYLFVYPCTICLGEHTWMFIAQHLISSARSTREQQLLFPPDTVPTCVNPDWYYSPSPPVFCPNQIYRKRKQLYRRNFTFAEIRSRKDPQKNTGMWKSTAYCLLYFFEKKAVKNTAFWGSPPYVERLSPTLALMKFNKVHR